MRDEAPPLMEPPRLPWQQWAIIALLSALTSLAGGWAINVETRLNQHVGLLAARGERIALIEGQIARLQDQDSFTVTRLAEIKELIEKLHAQDRRPR